MSLGLSLSLGITAGGESASSVIPYTASGEPLVDASIVGAQTNKQVNVQVVAANLEVFYLVASVACVVKTNSTGSPGNTWNLLAGEPLIWWNTALWTIPVSADITKLYVTTTADTRLRLWAGVEAAP